MLNIYTNMNWVMCLEWKDAASCDGNENCEPTEGRIQIHQENRSEKVVQQVSPSK